MKKNLFSLLVVGAALSFTACNNSGDGTGDNDSTANGMDSSTNVTGGTTSETSANDYSAFADSTERNSQAGYYLNAKTGKPLRLKVDRSTGSVTDESTGEPVWRYVDNRSWWVYGLENENDTDWYWRQQGQARMDKDQLTYKGENDAWVDYDKQYSTTDEKLSKSWKTKVGGTKIKFDKDGDIKIKDESGKTKYDADDNKIKTDSTKK